MPFGVCCGLLRRAKSSYRTRYLSIWTGRAPGAYRGAGAVRSLR